MPFNPSVKIQKQPGISLVEILITIGIFSTAIAGLYMAMQGMHEAINVAMRRDIEAAFANMKMSEVNPSNPLIETAYDVTSNTAVSLPSGDTVYYQRTVDSSITTPDIKYIDLFLYRGSTTTTAYRQFHREIAPYMTAYKMGETTEYYKDTQGWVWAPMNNNYGYVTGAGAYKRNGLDPTYSITNIDGSALCPTISGTPDSIPFQKSAESTGTRLAYKFFVIPNRTYILKIGAAEYDATLNDGDRKMDISFSGVFVSPNTTMDALTETGDTCSALVKSFRLTPMDLGSGLGTISVIIDKNAAAVDPPQVAFITLERVD